MFGQMNISLEKKNKFTRWNYLPSFNFHGEMDGKTYHRV